VNDSELNIVATFVSKMALAAILSKDQILTLIFE